MYVQIRVTKSKNILNAGLFKKENILLYNLYFGEIPTEF